MTVQLVFKSWDKNELLIDEVLDWGEGPKWVRTIRMITVNRREVFRLPGARVVLRLGGKAGEVLVE
jgi:hypothetical protein